MILRLSPESDNDEDVKGRCELSEAAVDIESTSGEDVKGSGELSETADDIEPTNVETIGEYLDPTSETSQAWDCCYLDQ